MDQKALKFLMNAPLLHMDMLEALRHGEADILYAGEDGVLIYHRESETHMLSAESEESAERITARLEHAAYIVLHQPYQRKELAQRFSLENTMPCHQAAWMRDAPVPVPDGGADIRPLGPDAFPAVYEHYTHIPDEGYIRSRISAGMLGIYVEGKLAGFIGTHPEGSMGMLEILPGYRRRGLGYLLENEMMRRLQARGRIPFAQIQEGNAASIALHVKLGMEVTEDASLTWLF